MYVYNCSKIQWPGVLISFGSGSPREDKDQIRDSAPEIRDVFGDFDDDEEEEGGYAVQHDIEQDSNVSARGQY